MAIYSLARTKNMVIYLSCSVLPLDGWASCCLISIRGQSHFIWVVTCTLSPPPCLGHPPSFASFIIVGPLPHLMVSPPCLVTSSRRISNKGILSS